MIIPTFNGYKKVEVRGEAVIREYAAYDGGAYAFVERESRVTQRICEVLNLLRDVLGSRSAFEPSSIDGIGAQFRD